MTAGVRHTLESFLVACKIVHGDRYDYSHINEYTNNKTPVDITCEVHGIFSQTPAKHLGGSGCTKCRLKSDHYSKVIDYLVDRGILEVVKFSSDKLVAKTVMEYKCACGYISSIQLKRLTYEKTCCSDCKVPSNTKSKVEWISLFKDKWGDKYTYDKFTTSGANKPCTVTCNIHGDFNTTPSRHKLRSGCPVCSRLCIPPDNKVQAERNKTDYLKSGCSVYFVHLKDDLYKIGITKDKVSRYSSIKKYHGGLEELQSISTNRYNAIYIENAFHEMLRSKLIGGKHFSEVFRLDDFEFPILMDIFTKVKNNYSYNISKSIEVL